MRIFLRRLRGIVGIGLIWSAAWAVAGALFGVVQRFLLSQSDLGPPAGVGAMALGGALMFAVYAFPIGTLFGGILAVAERRRQIEQLNVWRVGTWGFVAGAGVVLANVAAVRFIEGAGWPHDGVAAAVVAAALGTTSAATTLKLVRSGSPPSPPAVTPTLNPSYRSELDGLTARELGNQPSGIHPERAAVRRS